MENYKIELKWGFIFIGVQLLWMVMERVSGLHSTHIDKHFIVTNFFAIVAIAVFVFALRDKRENFYDGSMSYKQGFISGVIITLIVTILTPLSQFLTSEVISPNYFANVSAYAVEQGMMTKEQAFAQFNLQSYLFQATVGALVMGVITSAIVAFFVKKES